MSDFKPFGGNCWVRPGDDKLYSTEEMKQMETTSKLTRAILTAGELAEQTGKPHFICGSMVFPTVTPADSYTGGSIQRVVYPANFHYIPRPGQWRAGEAANRYLPF